MNKWGVHLQVLGWILQVGLYFFTRKAYCRRHFNQPSLFFDIAYWDVLLVLRKWIMTPT